MPLYFFNVFQGISSTPYSMYLTLPLSMSILKEKIIYMGCLEKHSAVNETFTPLKSLNIISQVCDSLDSQ